MHERSRLLLDELDAKMMAVTNRRLFTLSILTACLLPPTLVTGFFGMNTKDMPFQNSDGGTWMAGVVALAPALLAIGHFAACVHFRTWRTRDGPAFPRATRHFIMFSRPLFTNGQVA